MDDPSDLKSDAAASVAAEPALDTVQDANPERQGAPVVVILKVVAERVEGMDFVAESLGA